MLVLCYVVGLVFHRTVEISVGCSVRNSPFLIKKARQSLAEDFVIKQENDDAHITENYYIENYYTAYYWLQSNGKLGNIPLLEAQSAFLLNLWCVIGIYIGVCLVSKLNIIRLGDFLYVCGDLLYLFCLVLLCVLTCQNCKCSKKVRECLQRLLSFNGLAILLLAVMFIGLPFFIKGVMSSDVSLYSYFMKSDSEPLCLTGAAALFCLLPILRTRTELKIHRLVWEGEYFLKSDRPYKMKTNSQTKKILP